MLACFLSVSVPNRPKEEGILRTEQPREPEWATYSAVLLAVPTHLKPEGGGGWINPAHNPEARSFPRQGAPLSLPLAGQAPAFRSGAWHRVGAGRRGGRGHGVSPECIPVTSGPGSQTHPAHTSDLFYKVQWIQGHPSHGVESTDCLRQGLLTG